MGHWAIIKSAVSILPRGRLREAVFRHVDACPACQARLIGREDARKCLVQADQIGGLDKIWPAVCTAIKAGPDPRLAVRGGTAFRAAAHPRPKGRTLRWAAAAGGIAGAAAAIIFVTALIIPRGVNFAGAADPSPDPLRILSASIGGLPAETYIIPIPEDRMILVWFEPKPDKGERS